MTIARTIGLGLGLVLLVGVEAATLSRAQHAGEKAVAPIQKGSDPRQRVIELRTETDLLQLEYDAARANLFEALKKAGESDLEGQEALSKARSDVEADFNKVRSIEGFVENEELIDEKVNEMIKALNPEDRAKAEEQNRLYQAFLKGGRERQAAVDRLAQLELEARRESARRSIDRHRQNFVRKARNLHQKKLDLAEAEKQYQREAQ